MRRFSEMTEDEEYHALPAEVQMPSLTNSCRIQIVDGIPVGAPPPPAAALLHTAQLSLQRRCAALCSATAGCRAASTTAPTIAPLPPGCPYSSSLCDGADTELCPFQSVAHLPCAPFARDPSSPVQPCWPCGLLLPTEERRAHPLEEHSSHLIPQWAGTASLSVLAGTHILSPHRRYTASKVGHCRSFTLARNLNKHLEGVLMPRLHSPSMRPNRSDQSLSK
uniref:Uncharacterized protein n=1 Tax=Arundo donax TaxID=35708 RepID=A0A0A9DNN8_ARUDO